ncbi:hypothetical protein ACOSQ4_031567 [Xanthoceras sorbifolium]
MVFPIPMKTRLIPIACCVLHNFIRSQAWGIGCSGNMTLKICQSMKKDKAWGDMKHQFILRITPKREAQTPNPKHKFMLRVIPNQKHI